MAMSKMPLDQSSLKQLDELIEAELIVEDRAAIALVALLNGDPLPMADRLETGDEIDDTDRRYLARWLRGEIKRPLGPPKGGPQLELRKIKAARMVHRLCESGEGGKVPVKVAVIAVAEYFGVSRGTVYAWMGEWRKRRIPNKS